MALLFAYGTLRDRDRLLGLAPSARWFARGFMRDTNLYDLGSFPGMLRADPLCAARTGTFGNIFDVRSTDLGMLDAYEGSMFARERVQVKDLVSEDQVSAWAYIFRDALPSDAKLILCGDWLGAKALGR